MQLTSTTSSNMSFFERFYTDTNNLYTLQELQSQSNDTIQKDAVLTNQYVDMIQFLIIYHQQTLQRYTKNALIINTL